MTKRRDLYLIFKEAVNNLTKYSQAKNAIIGVKADGQKLELMVKDDGKGFDSKTAKAGNGLRNMEHRAKAVGGELSVTSSPGTGTIVRFVMNVS
jgi:signal transduction histidine kinase